MTHDTTPVRDAMAPLARLARAGFAVADAAATADVRGWARLLDAAAPDGASAVRVRACTPPYRAAPPHRSHSEETASEETAPDVWLVADGQVTAERAGGQVLTADEARAVADLARRVDAALGASHDLQWAMAAGRLLVVDATPVRDRPAPMPPGTWLKDADRYPEPFTALGASVAGPAISAGFTAMLTRYGALLERADVRFVDGEAYLRMTPVGGREGAPPPAWLLALLVRAVPTLRERVRRAARTANGTALARRQRRYEEEVRPALQREVAVLRGMDVTTLADAELCRHLQASLGLARRALGVHFDLLPAEVVPVYALVQWSTRVLHWDERATLELLAGCAPATSSPTRALAVVADRIRRHPQLTGIVAHGGPGLVDALTDADPTAGHLLRGWLEEYGLRPVHDDPGSPLFSERPNLIARLLLEAVESGQGDPARAAADRRARARAQLARRPAELVAFERVLAAAERAHRLREDSALWTGSMPAGLVHRAALEAGRRLTAAGRLDHSDDVVHLPADVLVAALTDPYPSGPDLRAVAERERAARERVRRQPGPPRYGPPPPEPPDVRALPEPARTLNAALLWSRPAPVRDPHADAAPDELTGLAGSAGRCTGPVCRVLSETDFAKVRRGDVIVCRTTDPAWSVLFGIAGALVTDAGGLLSHAGIVAREFHLPAVLGTGHGTRTLVDGQIVTVDGTTGHVRVVTPRS